MRVCSAVVEITWYELSSAKAKVNVFGTVVWPGQESGCYANVVETRDRSREDMKQGKLKPRVQERDVCMDQTDVYVYE